MPDSLTTLQNALQGRYRVERELGAGGMATVYLAHDERHDRPVAMKVLRAELAAILGGERFLKEIRLTANLQHPHILALHDSGEADGMVYYVMPYVEGESLRERLQREKQLPVEEAVRIAREVASALDYAHRHNVVHRDIKPENILLHDGSALVADFGIALAVSTAGGTRMTETGMSLGTPHYMSPEQAMGEREITARSDVYALGVVLYEMLIGEPPFTGPTAQAIVAKVMTEEPRPITIHRRTVPAHVETAVLTALAKLPADRFGSAAQFSDALAGHSAVLPITRGHVVAARPPAPPPRAVLAASALGLFALGLALGRFALAPRREAAAPARLSVQIPQDHRLTGAPVGTIAISPDGRTIVYAGESARGLQLYARKLEDPVGVPLPGTENAFDMMFSPDGAWLAFVSGNQIRKVPVSGGGSVVVPFPQDFVPSVWSRSDEFLGTNGHGDLGRVTGGGAFRLVAARDSAAGEGVLVPTDVMPDGSILAVAFTQGTSGPLYAIDPGSGERSSISAALVTGAAYRDGMLLWTTGNGELLAARFDLGKKRLTGSPSVLATDVRVAPGAPPQVSLSSAGSLAYVPSLPFHLVRVDRAGRLETLTDQPRRFHSPRVSPDGRRIAVDFSDQTRDVWLLDLHDRTMSRLSFENDGHDPQWMPDGRSVLYASRRGAGVGIMRRRTDGTGAAESVLVQGLALSAHAVTPDGRLAIAAALGSSGDFDLVTVTLDGSQGARRAEPLLATNFNEAFPSVSPDGRWLAYASTESGRSEVYVRSLRGEGGRVLVSQSGGTEPIWSRSGRELFYRDFEGPSLVAAAVETGPEPRVASRQKLFGVADYETSAPHANYDVTPDGRFVFVRQGRLSEIVLIQNWPALVR